MTNAFLAEFDALARDAFVGAGMADSAVYRSTPSAPAVNCTVLVDRSVERADEIGNVVVIGNAVRITAFRDQIAARPPLNAQFVLDPSGANEVLTVGEIERADESRWVCLCRA